MELLTENWKKVLTLEIGPEDNAVAVIWMAIRTGILNKKIPLGTQAPAYRQIAEFLGLHKSIVMKVMSKLKAEKLTVADSTRGTWIADHLPNKRGSSKKKKDNMEVIEKLLFDQKTLMPNHELTEKLSTSYRSALKHNEMLTTQERNMTDFPLLSEQVAIIINKALQSFFTKTQIFYAQGYRTFIHFICAALLPPKMMILVISPVPRQVREAISSATSRVEYVSTDRYGIALDELEKRCRQGKVGMVYMSSRISCPYDYPQLPEKTNRLLDLQKQHDFIILEDDRDAGFYEYMPNMLMERAKEIDTKIVYLRPFTLGHPDLNRINIIAGPENLIGQVRDRCKKTGFILDAVIAHALQEILKTSLFTKTETKVRNEIKAINKSIRTILSDSGLWEEEGYSSTKGWFFHLVPLQGNLPQNVYELLEKNGFGVVDLRVFENGAELRRGILISAAAYLGNNNLEKDLNRLIQFLKSIICS